MAQLFRRIIPLRVALFGLTKSFDEVNTPGYEDLVDTKGWAGVRRVFTMDKYGDPSREIVMAYHTASLSAIIGVLIGAVNRGSKAWLDFMENNQATQFPSIKEAKRSLQDRMINFAFRGACNFGVKIGAFTLVFMLVNGSVAAYVGQPGMMEYVSGGAITGGMFRANLGVKGAIAGSVVGGALGTLLGVIMYAILYLAGISMSDVQNSQTQFYHSRNDAIEGAEHKSFMEDYQKYMQDKGKIQSTEKT